MNQDFNDCLDKGKIKIFSRGKFVAPKEIRLAEEDLKIASASFSDGNFRWCVIQTYYSMFHSARALLYYQNYREHSHYCLIQAIRALYVGNKLLDLSLVEAMAEAKNLREAADYYGDYSQINAEKLLEHAKNFLKAAKDIIKNGTL
ncbi:MAG: HEPN domain-containing protein [Patescibacteria group bacterium]